MRAFINILLGCSPLSYQVIKIIMRLLWLGTIFLNEVESTE